MKRFLIYSFVIINIILQGFVCAKIYSEAGGWTCFFCFMTFVYIEINEIQKHLAVETTNMIRESVLYLMRGDKLRSPPKNTK